MYRPTVNLILSSIYLLSGSAIAAPSAVQTLEKTSSVRTEIQMFAPKPESRVKLLSGIEARFL